MAKYIPTIQATLETYLQWRLAHQQLSRTLAPDVARTIALCGWIPPAGPTAALALHARGYADTTLLDKALGDGSIASVRTVRGGRMLVEHALIPLAIAATGSTLERRWRTAWRTAGIEEAQREEWRAKILQVLANRDLAEAAFFAALPKPLTREGDETFVRKAGGHKTLAGLLLAEMEERGLVHEHLGNWARYEVRFPDLPKPAMLDSREVRYKIIERFFAWGNVANAEDLAWWGGWSTRESEEVLFSGDLPISNLVLTGSNVQGLFVHSSYTDTLKNTRLFREGPVHFIPARDPYFAHNPHFLDRIVDEAQREKLFRPRSMSLRALILHLGRPVATWRQHEESVEWAPATRIQPALRKRIQTTADELAEWMKAAGIKPDTASEA
jgi:hypothetical protein